MEKWQASKGRRESEALEDLILWENRYVDVQPGDQFVYERSFSKGYVNRFGMLPAQPLEVIAEKLHTPQKLQPSMRMTILNS